MTRLAVLVLVGMVSACGPTTAANGPSPSPSGDFVACGPVESPALQASTHLIGDADPPAPWSSVPATSGWHTSGPPATGVVAEPLDDRQVVAVLETGRVVLAHDGTVDLTGIDHIVEESGDRLVVAEYAGRMPTPVALLSWGRLTRCDDVQFSDVTAWVVQQSGPDLHEDA